MKIGREEVDFAGRCMKCCSFCRLFLTLHLVLTSATCKCLPPNHCHFESSFLLSESSRRFSEDGQTYLCPNSNSNLNFTHGQTDIARHSPITMKSTSY